MRAMIIRGYGGGEVLEPIEMPAPVPRPREVRIRVTAIAVNPADTKWRQGMFDSFAPLTFPHVLGYDVAGVIDAVGSDVVRPLIGDRVVAMLKQGAYAEYAVIAADEVAAIPETLEEASAAALPTAALTGVQMIEDHIRPAPGERVLVTGATGGVGRFAVFAALRQGARVVAAVRERHTTEALALGAQEIVVLGASAVSIPQFDHVADTVGGEQVSALCRRVPPAGRIRTAATTPIDAAGLATEPVFIIVRNDKARLEGLAQDVAAQRITMPIAERLPLAAAAHAHELVERGGLGGKVILNP